MIEVGEVSGLEKENMDIIVSEAGNLGEKEIIPDTADAEVNADPVHMQV